MDTLYQAGMMSIEETTQLGKILSVLPLPVAICITSIIVTGMILFYLDKHPSGKFVLREACHDNVTKLTEDANLWFGILHKDIERLEARIDSLFRKD